MNHNFEFLAWVDRLWFRDDFFNELVELGVSRSKAFSLSHSDFVKNGSIVQFYQDYGRTEPDIFNLYINDMWRKWNEGRIRK